MTGDTFTARISRRDGRAIYTSPGYATREEAIKDAFAARPAARECSTARGIGKFDIRWHRREEVTP